MVVSIAPPRQARVVASDIRIAFWLRSSPHGDKLLWWRIRSRIETNTVLTTLSRTSAQLMSKYVLLSETMTGCLRWPHGLPDIA